MPLIRRAAAVICTSLFVAVVLGGCSRGAVPSPPATGTTVASGSLPDPQPTPRADLADAVRDLLAAEKRGDRAASFLLISRQSRAEFKDLADWTARRQQLPTVTGFKIQADSEGSRANQAGKVAVEVSHVPALDPFKGLSPAREIQTFTGRKEGDGWLVDGDPSTDPILPADSLAVTAAVAWVAAVQACDQPKAETLQAVTILFGTASAATGLCAKPGPVVPGEVGRLSAGVDSSDIVAQYSTDALEWARVVRITSPAAFGVVLAPLGDRWQVLGLAD